MQPLIAQLVESIHNSPDRVLLVTAGAGASALAHLTAVAGASRTLLEGLIPYDRAAFTDFLEQPPEQYVSAETARLLAGRALARARWLAPDEEVTGLACTATIATDRPKKGDHRAHIASWQPGRIVTGSLHLEKGARTRAGEEALICRLLLNMLASACDLEAHLPLPLRNGNNFQKEAIDLAGLVQKVSAGRDQAAIISADGALLPVSALPPLLLAGAFNPLHRGHLALARAAEAYAGQSLAFELSLANVDKPDLETSTTLKRLAQFAGRWPVATSRAATFLQKSAVFPGTTFVVGYDTAVRILHRRYYDGSKRKMLQALATFRKRGCAFLVAGRADDAGHFYSAHALKIPADFAGLFHALPNFRKDISSTEIRQEGRRGSY